MENHSLIYEERKFKSIQIFIAQFSTPFHLQEKENLVQKPKWPLSGQKGHLQAQVAQAEMGQVIREENLFAMR